MSTFKRLAVALLLAGAVLTFLTVNARKSAGAAQPAASADPLVARGRYLVAFGGCNDCHTPGWRDSGGNIPDSRWMTGGKIGYRGPWGTVYPPNVRLLFHEMSENGWIFSTQTRGGRPPMIWHDIKSLTIDDRRSIYRFIRSLGKAGVPAPDDVPPSLEPKTPYYLVLPQTPAPH